MLTKSEKKILVLLISNSTSYNTTMAMTSIAIRCFYAYIFVVKSRCGNSVYLPVLATSAKKPNDSYAHHRHHLKNTGWLFLQATDL